jgi:hypothetical protein
MNKKSNDIAINYSNSSRILFSTIPTILAVASASISILFPVLLILLSPSSLFILAVDMPPSPSPQSPSLPPATTTEKPTGTPPSTTTTTPPNIPKIEEKKDPKDGDTILFSKSADGNTEAATKVSKDSNTKTMNFNRGYITGFAYVFGFGFGSENVDIPVDQFLKFKNDLENKYVNAPEEFRIGFDLGFINAIQFLKINKDVLSSDIPAKK